MTKAWRETVTLPTYEVGQPEKLPMFLENRVYQGSSGVVYPYPVIESIANEPTPHDWHAVFMENEYLKVMVLPELGGRIQMAYDKLRQRHFVYYNHVVKPALVGLAGPWISGGIEFNWPQHHRPSTYMPVDCDIEQGEDGSVTVWVNEVERMFHQKGMAGFTLRPGCAYLEIRGRVSNPTPLPQTFLWWANPAVEVNDHYQSVFPPDVNAVFDHGKRAVSTFPIATGTYYKMDYSAGVDISNYKNIKVPTSYMAVNSKYDFEGGYENDSRAGMLHVASHHVSPGKKQWTWGNGDFGRAWDRNLTDEVTTDDGSISGITRKGFRPYIELMAGVFTENQPDFSWLMPYEEKLFTQYFMPYREVGMVKQATRDFVMGIEEVGKSKVRVKLMATSRQTVRLCLSSNNGQSYLDEVVTLTPEDVFDKVVALAPTSEANAAIKPGSLTFTINSCDDNRGRLLLSWRNDDYSLRPTPDAAQAALPPKDTKTNDQLFLTGLHLEQYRHATWCALDYYEEALRRDADDVRCLNQAGLWYLRRGRPDRARRYLRRAVEVWQRRNPNPYDGEPLFNLALAERLLGNFDEAYALFWKATWNKAWADAAYFEAACISIRTGNYEQALEELGLSIDNNSHNHKARAMKTVVLRRMGRCDEALRCISDALMLDRFNYVCLYERHLINGEPLDHMYALMHGNPNNYHELALDYAHAGLWTECAELLCTSEAAHSHPLTYYYIGWAHANMAHADEAASFFRQAEQMDPGCCFPNRLEDVDALTTAVSLNPKGARAPYYLGCLYYDKRQYDKAVYYWEMSARLDDKFPGVWRNLALARFNKQGRSDEALDYMERAFSLDQTDARMLMELDQLRKRMHVEPRERLDQLQAHQELIAQRDDLVLEEVTLLNQLGRFDEAMHKLDQRRFHPWEGGEGKVTAQYQLCRVEQAKRLMAGAPGKQSLQQAIGLLEQCLDYPPHLGEGKLYGAQENDFHYLLGLAYDALGQRQKARDHWELATLGPQEPAAAMYYNDAKPDKIFYQGLALAKLGRHDEARARFYRLVNYGRQHLYEKQTMDYFAVSLPDLLIWQDSSQYGKPSTVLAGFASESGAEDTDHNPSDLDRNNTEHCRYMLALGCLGLGNHEQGEHQLRQVEAGNPNHQGAQQLRSLLDCGLATCAQSRQEPRPSGQYPT